MKKISIGREELETYMEEVRKKLFSEKGIPDSITLKTNESVLLKKEEKVEIAFTNEAYKKMNALVDKAEKEIGWYGIVQRESEKKFVINDIFLVPQTVTGVTVQTDDKEYVDWINGLPDEVINNMRFYGHSHVRMGCSPSGTDAVHYKNMIQNCNDFYIFGIFNKSGSYWFNIYDIENNTLYENSDITYVYYVTPEETWAEEQIEKYVKEKKYDYGNSNFKSAPKEKGKDSWGSWYDKWNRGCYHDNYYD